MYKRRESCSVAKPNNLIYLVLVSYGAFRSENSARSPGRSAVMRNEIEATRNYQAEKNEKAQQPSL